MSKLDHAIHIGTLKRNMFIVSILIKMCVPLLDPYANYSKHKHDNETVTNTKDLNESTKYRESLQK